MSEIDYPAKIYELIGRGAHREILVGEIKYDEYDLSPDTYPSNDMAYWSSKDILIPTISPDEVLAWISPRRKAHPVVDIATMGLASRVLSYFRKGQQYRTLASGSDIAYGELIYSIYLSRSTNGQDSYGQIGAGLHYGPRNRVIYSPRGQGVFQSREAYKQDAEKRSKIQDKWTARDRAEWRALESYISDEQRARVIHEDLQELGILTSEFNSPSDQYVTVNGTALRYQDTKDSINYNRVIGLSHDLTHADHSQVQTALRDFGGIISLVYWRLNRLAEDASQQHFRSS